ncbi:hypothetical protein ACFOY8_14990 [Thalassospira xianhensis]|nr:hypothetical protein [Thalassospira xianhensis]
MEAISTDAWQEHCEQPLGQSFSRTGPYQMNGNAEIVSADGVVLFKVVPEYANAVLFCVNNRADIVNLRMNLSEVAHKAGISITRATDADLGPSIHYLEAAYMSNYRQNAFLCGANPYEPYWSCPGNPVEGLNQTWRYNIGIDSFVKMSTAVTSHWDSLKLSETLTHLEFMKRIVLLLNTQPDLPESVSSVLTRAQEVVEKSLNGSPELMAFKHRIQAEKPPLSQRGPKL